MNADALTRLLVQIRSCRHCELPHGPRPIVQAGRSARILIIGQAPGSLVHASGIPWDDPSGDRLREWTRLDKPTFYNPSRVAQMPMGFCYPGKGESADLPPRPECAPLWHNRLRALISPVEARTRFTGPYARYSTCRLKRGCLSAMIICRKGDATLSGKRPLPNSARIMFTCMTE